MPALEPWQRYRQATPCPICGGYGAYKEEKQCKGFLVADGSGAFCSKVSNASSPVWMDRLGMHLYFHPFERGGGRQQHRKRPRSRVLMFKESGQSRKWKRERTYSEKPTWRDWK